MTRRSDGRLRNRVRLPIYIRHFFKKIRGQSSSRNAEPTCSDWLPPATTSSRSEGTVLITILDPVPQRTQYGGAYCDHSTVDAGLVAGTIPIAA